MFADLVDPSAYGTPFGPAGLHPDEPAFEPSRYWRGSSWPQLLYLLWVAARRHGMEAAADALGARLVERMVATGFAEHWNPVTGDGLGARPQSWNPMVARARAPSSQGVLYERRTRASASTTYASQRRSSVEWACSSRMWLSEPSKKRHDGSGVACSS